jgi:hypothetical protein
MGSFVALLILLENFQQSGVHICDFIIVRLREQKLLNLEWFYFWKLSCPYMALYMMANYGHAHHAFYN